MNHTSTHRDDEKNIIELLYQFNSRAKTVPPLLAAGSGGTDSWCPIEANVRFVCDASGAGAATVLEVVVGCKLAAMFLLMSGTSLAWSVKIVRNL